MRFFDVHTHVQFAAFREDYDEVISRALEKNIWLVNVGTQKNTSQKAIDFANSYPEGVFATVGLHPIHTEASFHDADELGEGEGAETFTSRGEEFDIELYKKMAENSKAVAIGECGLDYYRIENKESRIKQEKAFRSQIELAIELKKPLMIHCREAFGELIKILNSCFLIRNSSMDSQGIIHFFSGSKDDAKILMDLGFSFSFGGVITFARQYEELVKYIPLEKILLETDAPYVAPVPYRGKRNEPSYVIEVAKKLAEIKSLDIEAVAAATTENAERIFFKNSL